MLTATRADTEGKATMGEHEITTATSVNDIARDLTIWLAARDFPGRPTRQVSEFQNRYGQGRDRGGAVGAAP